MKYIDMNAVHLLTEAVMQGRKFSLYNPTPIIRQFFGA